MRRACFLVLLVLLAAPISLPAQDRRLSARLDAAAATGVQRIVDSARQLGLPTEPLVQKALEGSTMGASDERIVSAVEALLRQLTGARDALGAEANEAEIGAAAGALRAGLSVPALRRLRDLRSGQSLVVPIAVLTDLVAEGMPPDQAMRAVFDLARHGRPDDEFIALRRRSQAAGGGREVPVSDRVDQPAPVPARDPPSAP